MGQWSVDPTLLHAKRLELTALVNEVGFERAMTRVVYTVRNNTSKFWPTIAEIRSVAIETPKRDFCGNCIEGLVYVDASNREAGMRKCECRRAGKTADVA